jgi:hypothetical protein
MIPNSYRMTRRRCRNGSDEARFRPELTFRAAIVNFSANSGPGLHVAEGGFMQEQYQAPVLEVVGSVADVTGGFASGAFVDARHRRGHLKNESS